MRDWWRNVSIDLSFVSTFFYESNSVIKFSQTRIWKWHWKRPLFLLCPAKNYSNLSFNKDKKAGNEVVLNWRFLLVNEKPKRALKKQPEKEILVVYKKGKNVIFVHDNNQWFHLFLHIRNWGGFYNYFKARPRAIKVYLLLSA